MDSSSYCLNLAETPDPCGMRFKLLGVSERAMPHVPASPDSCSLYPSTPLIPPLSCFNVYISLPFQCVQLPPSLPGKCFSPSLRRLLWSTPMDSSLLPVFLYSELLEGRNQDLVILVLILWVPSTVPGPWGACHNHLLNKHMSQMAEIHTIHKTERRK